MSSANRSRVRPSSSCDGSSGPLFLLLQTSSALPNLHPSEAESGYQLVQLLVSYMLLLLSTPLHQRAVSRFQHPNHVAASSLSPQVARKGSTLSGFVQRSRLERDVGRDLHSNKWEEV